MSLPLLFLLACLLQPLTSSNLPSGYLYVGYFATWTEKSTTTASKTLLANLPSYVNIVNLSFMKPDVTYAGDLDISGTGMDLPYDGSVLQDALAALRKKNPKAKILISVGGGTASLSSWSSLNEAAIAQFVADFDLDGVDIDFEPSDPQCTFSGGAVSCQTDAQFLDIVTRFRAVLPSPNLLTIAASGVGAYGQGDFVNSQPAWSGCGVTVNLLLSTVGKTLDIVNIMSYDVDIPPYSPKEALRAFQSIYDGKIVLGLEIYPEADGDHKLTISEVDSLADYVIKRKAAGLMIWHLHKTPTGTISASNPDPDLVGKEVCKKFDMLDDCSSSLMGKLGLWSILALLMLYLW